MTLIKSISGIRGTIGGVQGENLTPLDVVSLTIGFGRMIKDDSSTEKPKIVLGRDARTSGIMIKQLVTGSLTSIGVDVIDLDLSTTPTVEMAVVHHEANGGIILTASHNPQMWNALKFLNSEGVFISAEQGQKVLELAESETVFADHDRLGKITHDTSALQRHIDAIVALDLVDTEAIRSAGFSIIVDPVNSSGSIAVPALLKALGVEKIAVINEEPNGFFAHNPEPLPENLTVLSSEMHHGNYDLGIVVDPDVDRLAFMDETGNPMGEEYTLVSIADYVLPKKKGPTVSNLSSTQALKDITEKHGQQYHASAVGEVNVVSKMKEKGAVIGGEGNGGIILPELHYGRDALVGIALFLTHLANSKITASKLRASLPGYHIAKKKITLEPGLDLAELLGKIQDQYSSKEIITIDGVKIIFDNEWVHLRKSNTEPIIRIYAESDSESKAEHLAEKLILDIKELLESV